MSRSARISGAKAAMWLLLAVVFLYRTAGLLLPMVLTPRWLQQPALRYCLIAAEELMLLALPCVVFFAVSPRSWHLVKSGFEAPTLRETGYIALLALVGMLFFQLLSAFFIQLLLALGLSVPYHEYPLPDGVADCLLAVLAQCLLPALCEEALFRGVVYPGLTTSFNRQKSVMLTALLFALMHGSLSALPAHLGVGIVVTMLVAATGKLYLAVLYHFFHNLYALLFSLLSEGFVKGNSTVLLFGLLAAFFALGYALLRLLRRMPGLASITGGVSCPSALEKIQLAVLLLLLAVPYVQSLIGL